MRIRVAIDRLVVDGPLLQGEEPAAVQRALELELSRLLAVHTNRTAFIADGALPTLPPALLVTVPRSRSGLGQRIAAAVHNSVAPGR
jgi:hypothetical protein